MTHTTFELSAPPEDALGAQLEVIYLSAYAEPPYREGPLDASRFRNRLATEGDWDGFRIVIATETDPCGFAYGYRATPGRWWPDTVAAQLPSRLAGWAEDAFALIEIAVAPGHRGRGIGTNLHDSLLSNTGCATALLTTYDLDTSARRLYQRSGWRDLISPFRFPGHQDPYVLMGRVLSDHRGDLEAPLYLA